ncbi:MAG: DegT/DnrJ/EryC1/StrS family aminotransferase [Clostridiaceae bacterium]
MKVEATDLKRTYALHQEEYEQAALRALRSGWYILGNELEQFENDFAAYCGAKHCIGLNSGQDALILAVRALKIGVGDEVIVPSNTYIATVLGVTENGATPIFVEPDVFMNIDVARIEEAITTRTKAIIAVHLYGQACNMAPLAQLAQRHGLYLLEDCAQAHGAAFQNKKVGTFGTIGCFSFYPTKPIGAFGDAGAVITDHDGLAEKVRMLRNYGSRKKYINEIIGVNSRLDEVQAAILQVSLSHLDERNGFRVEIANTYDAGINNEKVRLPRTLKGATHVYHQYPILCKDRDALQAHLLKNGVKTIIHYPIPPHLAECYCYLGYFKGNFPIAETLANEELSLPIYAGMPMDEVWHVVQKINEF